MELARAIEARLTTAALGRTLVYRDETGSTMDDARALVRERGEPFGTVIVAGRQTAGRGRLGRPFVSPPGGLYLTAILRPPGAIELAWRCGFAAALAARDAIVDAGGPAAEFDWPNDLVIGERKVGGILMELRTPEPGTLRAPVLLLGIGLNLGPDPRLTDAAAAGPGGPVPGLGGDARADVAARLLARLEQDVPACGDESGWRALLDRVRGISRAANGARVTVREPDGTEVSGQGIGIRDDGALRLRLPDGTERTIRYAERVYDTG